MACILLGRVHPLEVLVRTVLWISMLSWGWMGCGPTYIDKPDALSDGGEGDGVEEGTQRPLGGEVGDLEEDAAASEPTEEPSIDPTLDSDNDGVTDVIELEYGSDPHDPDTDGDGFDDGDEVAQNTNPMNGNDYPYAGGWPIDGCRNDVQSTGNGVGQTAHDFTLTDQFGESVRLHDFCGQAVMLVASAMWCGPCQTEAEDVARLHRQYEEEGFLVITLLGENERGQTPSRSDLQGWASAFGIDHPVVADPGFGVASRFVNGGSLYLPSTSLLGEGLEVLKRDAYVSTQDIEGALP